ncbi:zinc-ribbon domain-containing protein [Pseudoduganella sp. UC29_106]|uniref:zinc-ribbon domain-containing protein n=1 Tax=Pseudoduganella sp. UC29_106 TaxID=3374553 RepID=UPI003756D75A
MALATKCPHCNTIFRVAADQLKLRGGIVRCGACNEVFDGNAALVEPARPTPVIPDVVIAPSPSSPASNYVHGAPVDFDLDALDADAPPGGEPAAAEGEAEPPEDTSSVAESAPAVWRTAAFKMPLQAPEAAPHPAPGACVVRACVRAGT